MQDIDAYIFWKRFDDERDKQNLTINQIADDIRMKAQTIREQRSNNALPKTNDLYNMASRLGVSMEYLLTGKKSLRLNQRVMAIAQYLEDHPEKLDAIEVLLFEKSAGQSSKSS